MSASALLEAFRTAAEEHIGVLGPFVVKKQLTNLNMTAEKFRCEDAEPLIRRVADGTAELFGGASAEKLRLQLHAILRSYCAEGGAVNLMMPCSDGRGDHGTQ